MARVLERLKLGARNHPGRILLWAGALVLLVLLAGFVVWPSYHFHAAQRSLEQGDLESAQRHLDAGLLAWPRSAPAHFQAARVARRRDALDLAWQHLASAQQIEGVTPAIALESLLLRSQEGDVGSVESQLHRLVAERHPDRVLILEALAKGYRAALRLPDFVNTIDLLLEAQPDNFQAHFWRGQAAESLGRHADALGNFQKAVELDPQSTEARLRLAANLDRMGHPREALAQYEYLRQRLPQHPEVLLGLARCRLDAHELEDARQLLDEVLKEHPDHVPALVEQARVSFQLGDPGAAEKLLERAVHRDPHDREAHRLLLAYLESEGKSDDARHYRAALLQIERDSARTASLMLQIMETPHDPAPRCELGIILLRSGQEEKGLHWLNTALKEDPGHAPAREAVADYYRRAKTKG
jgi:tetratricopeptide (TPR) repeat protein